MTTTGTRISTVSTKHRIKVEFGVNHVFSFPTYAQTWNSTGQYVFEGQPMEQTLAERMKWLGDRWEAGLKSEWVEWDVKDTSRGTSWYEDLVCTMENMYSDFWNAYSLTWKCTVTDATVVMYIERETDIDVNVDEFAEWVQAQAEQAAADWFTMRMATPITE